MSSSLLLQRPPTSTLFPYTTLFRSSSSRVPKPPGKMTKPSAGFTKQTFRATHCNVIFWAERKNASHQLAACRTDRKSTRLNSSHEWISYAVFCLKKKKKKKQNKYE